ncbi:MAG: hypothetical protein JO286_17800 [Solirubrobacterales bacterium]|nr:hypothetical protein [Solirubrobacterales bacterium]MBV9809044.1 hypothetical protein [Solirubrobacterales bacterium]
MTPERAMKTDPVKAIADAVLYEGYILWPYRRSALKNQRRFTFGGVYPPAHAAGHPDDPCAMQAEVLLRGEAEVGVTVRFLQVVRRTVVGPDGEPVDERVVDGELLPSWEEAIEREIAAPGPIEIAAGVERDGLEVRCWERLDGEVEVITGLTPRTGVRRVTVTVRNLSAFEAGGARPEAMKRTLCSTHILLKATPGGAFISLTDPPAELADEAAACRNVGCWPVLVGEPGDAGTMLASPIILEDYPRIAPESPGDMFDGGEIDQLLVLNIMALTECEQAEMAASDPRAAEILERVQRLTPEQLMTLHGRTVLR